MVTRVLAALVSVGILLAVAPAASAHPSDADTLTIDLLIDGGGVILVDAAANPGENTIDGALPTRDRRRLASEVLKTLRVPARHALVDPTTSERYHEVGVRMYLLPGSTSWLQHRADYRTLLELSTRSLQQLAARYDMGRLKLGVCPVLDRLGPLLELEIVTSTPGTPAASHANEREHCSIWVRTPAEDAVRMRVQLPGDTFAPS